MTPERRPEGGDFADAGEDGEEVEGDEGGGGEGLEGGADSGAVGAGEAVFGPGWRQRGRRELGGRQGKLVLLKAGWGRAFCEGGEFTEEQQESDEVDGGEGEG